MYRRADVLAALAKNGPAVDRLKAVKHRNIKQAEALITDLLTQNKLLAELATLPPDGPSPAKPTVSGTFEVPTDVPTGDLFVALADPSLATAVYIQGGSHPDPEHPELPGARIGNPDGLTWNEGNARKWWAIVIDNNIDYSKVRPVFQPGSHVLTDEGIRAAVTARTSDGAWVAPNDWNPLGLPVIP